MLRGVHAAGLEISTGEIKLVVLRRSADGWAAIACASEPLPPGVVAPDAIRDPGALARALKRLRRHLPSRFTPVHAAVPGGVAVLRRVRMPAMSRAAVQKTIRLQTDQYLPMGSGTGSASYATLPDGPDAPGMSVLIAGSSEENLQALASAFRQGSMRLASLTAAAMGLSPLAAQWEAEGESDAAAEAPGVVRSENTAVVLVQEEIVSAFVFRKGLPLVARTLNNGAGSGRDVMMELRQSLMVDSRPPARLILLGNAPPEWFALLRSLYSLPGTVSSSVVRSSVPILVSPPMPGGLPTDYAVAAGLAMSALLPAGRPQLNVLKPQLRMRPPRPWLWPAVAMGTSLALLAASGAFWYTQMTQIRRERAAVSAQLPPPVTPPADLSTIDQYQAALAELKQAIPWSTLVSDLTRRAPAGLVVLSIGGGTEAGPAQGAQAQSPAPAGSRITLTGTAPGRAQVNDYVASLRASGWYANVSLRTVRHTAANGPVTFDMILTLKAGGSGS